MTFSQASYIRYWLVRGKPCWQIFDGLRLIYKSELDGWITEQHVRDYAAHIFTEPTHGRTNGN